MMSTYFNLFHFHCGSEEGHRFYNKISGFLNMELHLFHPRLNTFLAGSLFRFFDLCCISLRRYSVSSFRPYLGGKVGRIYFYDILIDKTLHIQQELLLVRIILALFVSRCIRFCRLVFGTAPFCLSHVC